MTSNELVSAVRIAVGSRCFNLCTPADRDGDDRVTVAELIAGVGALLESCTSAPPTPAPTPTQRPAVSTASELYREFHRTWSRACAGNGSRLFVRQGLYSFSCMTGRGHEADLTIETFGDAATARERFDRMTPAWGATTFADYPAAAWQCGGELPPFEPTHYLAWLADCVVIRADSWNESLYNNVPSPAELSESVREFVETVVVPACP